MLSQDSFYFEGQLCFQVLYEDNHLLIVNKTAGILTQPTEDEEMSIEVAAKAYLREKYDKKGNIFVGIPHRLDRPVSGVLLIAKTSKSLERLTAAFRERTIQKTYWALVEKMPPEPAATLQHWLKKNTKTNKTTAFWKATPEAQIAELSYKVIQYIAGAIWLEVNPLTGRPHQIRAQLASIGCSIVGDVKYQASKPNEDENIALHARAINFLHPTRKEWLKVEAPLPEVSYWQAVKVQE